MKTETKTVEERLKEQLNQLEATLETERAELRKKFSKEKLDEVSAISSTVDDLKSSIRFEQSLREKYWKQYKGKLMPEDFSSFWNSTLRTQALLRESLG